MTTSPVQIADLIRTIDGAEVPAAGRWHVGSGQPVRLTTRGVRHRSTNGRIVTGTLDVTDGIVGSSLQISVTTDAAGGSSDAGVPTRDPPPGALRFTLTVTEITPSGRWRAVGTSTSEAGFAPVTVDIEYRGVYRHARHTSLWLTVDAGLDRAADRSRLRRLVGPRVRLESDLTLHPATAA